MLDQQEETGLNILERSIRIIEKYGIWKVFKGLMLIGCFIYVLYNGINVDRIVDNVFAQKEEEHEAALEQRKKIDPEIRLILKELLVETGANRAFVIEFHNGTSNSHGLSFFYGEMPYEEVTPGTMSIDEDYQNINLSRFPFCTYLCDHNFWCGSMEELMKIDKKFTLRLVSNDVNYLAIRTMYGSNGKEIGFLGITYLKENTPGIEMVNYMVKNLDIAKDKLILKLDFNQFYEDNY